MSNTLGQFRPAALVVLVVFGSLGASAGCSPEPERTSRSTTSAAAGRAVTTAANEATPTTAAQAPTLEPTGELAILEGVGSVHLGTVPDGGSPQVNVAAAPAGGPWEGVLEIGEGMHIEVAEPVDGALEVRLRLPEEPSPDAVPVVMHVRDDGTVAMEPGLWDPTTNEIVVWASEFSDRYGVWFDPRNWVEEVSQVADGAFDMAADFISGRTDPPGCRNNAPSWSSASASELSSLHDCLQLNVADDGAERAEVFFKSNRNTAQFVGIPTGGEYTWVDNQPDWLRPILTWLGTGNEGDVLLLGGQSMSVGFRQPFESQALEFRTYQTQFVGFLNQISGLTGSVSPNDVLALAVPVRVCLGDLAGVSANRLDVVPDGFKSLDDFTSAMIPCVLELAQNPDLVVSAADEVLREAGIDAVQRNQSLGQMRIGLDRLAPVAKRLAQAIAVSSAGIRVWDVIFDSLAEGELRLELTGSAPPKTTQPAQELSPEQAAVDFVRSVVSDDDPERFIRDPAVLQQARQIILQPGVALEVQGLSAYMSEMESGSPDECLLHDVVLVCYVEVDRPEVDEVDAGFVLAVTVSNYEVDGGLEDLGPRVPTFVMDVVMAAD